MTAISLLSACGGSFETPTAALTSGNNGSSSVGGGNAGVITDPTSPISKVEMKGLVTGGDADGALAIDIDKVNKTLILSVPLTLATFSADISLNLPQYPDIKFYTYTDSNFMNHFAVSIPLKYVLRGVNFGNPQKLPNGENLPYFADGEAPSTAFVIDSIKNVKMNLYISSSGIGVFVSNPQVPSYLGFTWPIKNQTQTKIIGAFSLVRKTTTGDGGFYVATRIPDDIAKVLNDYIGL